jgi:2-iminobutanoate/2-iminopropanoate deaminase
MWPPCRVIKAQCFVISSCGPPNLKNGDTVHKILMAAFAATAFAATALTATAAHAAAPDRQYIEPPGYDAKTSPPFSNGVMESGTFYVAGHIGLDSATGQAAADPENEARLMMDAVQKTLAEAGLTMDDLVSTTIYCTDLDLYAKFNAVYRSYFHGHFPARAFIGVSKLVRGAHFELAGTAIKSKRR